MAKAKKAKKRRTAKRAKRSLRSPRRKPASRKSASAMVGWGIIVILLKVFAIAFLAQGFILQLASGRLYLGLLHYSIGVILYMLAWHLHKSKHEM